MSLARSVSASQAEEYYYEKDPIMSPEGKGENSEWYGSLKDDFELSGRIRSEDFKAMLSQLDPRTGKELVSEGVNGKKRAGVDLAFSPPKSVSIMALHCKDKRIISAHKEAVKEALDFVEENFIYYREKINDKLVKIKSDNMIVSTFDHSTSRALDPQLHTHAIIFNITRTNKGDYKAISNEKIYKYQTLINNIYQNALAIKLREMRYKLDNYDNKFEIRGVPEEARDVFSKRTREIDAICENVAKKYPEKTEAQIRDIATLISRNKKDRTIGQQELYKRWERDYSADEIQKSVDEVLKIGKEGIKNVEAGEQIQTIGEEITAATAALEIPGPADPDNASNTYNELLSYAVSYLHKTKSTFNGYDLLNSLIMQNRTGIFLNDLKLFLEEGLKRGDIIALNENNLFNATYSTAEMIKLEADIVETVLKGIDGVESLLNGEKVKQLLPSSLTEGQKEFVEHVLTTKDRVSVVQGDAGTGKTFAVKTLKDIISNKRPGVEIIGLGFTGKAARELSEASGIKTSTIASFLLAESNQEQDMKRTKERIIIVDESSMVSSKDMLALLEKAKDGRVVFVGDCKQLQAIGAGRMFKDLSKNNVIKTVTMEETLRQKTPLMKELVSSIKDYQETDDENSIYAAANLLENNGLLVETKSKSNVKDISSIYVREKAIDEYLNAGDDCLMLVSTRAQKDALNVMAREKHLDPNKRKLSREVVTRESIYASGYLVGEYKAGDIIVVDRKEGRVESVDIENNKISVAFTSKKTGNVEKKDIYPVKTEFIAYRESAKEFAPGEKIIFTRNDKRLGVQNGLSGVITNLDEYGNAKVSVKDKEITFNVKSYPYLDYGYALTVHKAQGQTCDKAIFVHEYGNNVTTESFYVAATRARYEFKVITSDKEDFADSITHAQHKSSTLDYSLNTPVSKSKPSHSI